MPVKAVDFEKKISDGRDIHIYVLGVPEAAAELRKGIGKAIGKSVLRSVEDGKMKILLNSTSSGEEGLEWNPAIFKIAKMVQ